MFLFKLNAWGITKSKNNPQNSLKQSEDNWFSDKFRIQKKGIINNKQLFFYFGDNLNIFVAHTAHLITWSNTPKNHKIQMHVLKNIICICFEFGQHYVIIATWKMVPKADMSDTWE